MNPTYKHKLWDDKKVDAFVKKNYPEYLPFIQKFPSRMYLVDFVRYLILKKEGGVYMDLDVITKKSLPTDIPDYIIGRGRINTSADFSMENSKVSNNVLKLKTPEEYQGLIDYAISETKRIEDGGLYKKWVGRRFLNSVSAYMFLRYVRMNKIESSIKFYDYFIDYEGRSWTTIINPKASKGFKSKHKGKNILSSQASANKEFL